MAYHYYKADISQESSFSVFHLAQNLGWDITGRESLL